MNRLKQTEPATFSILPCWAFFRDSYFSLFYKMFDKAAHILKKIQYSVATLYFPRRLAQIPKKLVQKEILMAIFFFESSNVCLGNYAENDATIT
jgi:hypothetical protein